MKIKLSIAYFLYRKRLLETLMRTFIFLFCATLFSLAPNNIVSQNSKIIIEEDKTLTVDEVFDLIIAQTDYNFFYEEGIFKDFPNIKVKKGVIRTNKLLKQSLLNGDFEIKITNNYDILIKKKAPSKIDIKQSYDISGTIADLSGQPLPGANILEKGTSNGTQTDFDGKFSLSVSNSNAILVISYLGFKTKEVSINNQATLAVVLEEDTASLDEIVVIGYGTQSSKNVTQSVVQVNAEDLDVDKRPVANLQNALVGSAPGLNVIQSSGGRLGGGINIRVREASALGTRDALILIDGFAGNITDINPNDIASVSILKDAAATSIYGARGANGVVLVTTKNTKKNEKLSLTYSYSHSFQSPAKTADLLNAEEFIEFANEAEFNEGVRNGQDPLSITPIFSDEMLQRARDGFYPNTNWIEELYSETASQVSHNLTINGGSEKTGYTVGMGILDQDGLLVGPDNLKRYNLRLKIDSDITDWLTLGVNASYTSRITDNVPNLEGNSSRGRPFFPVRLSDGRFVDKGAAVGNPNAIGRALSGSFDRNERDALNLQLYGKITPIKNLTLEQRVSITKRNNFRRIWNNPFEVTILDELTLDEVSTTPIQSTDRNIELRGSSGYSINNLTTLTYDYSINNEHNFEAFLGFQSNEGEFQEVRASRFNFVLDNVQDLTRGLEINGLGNNSERAFDRATISYFGRLTYNYKSKYLLAASFRNDESSNFGSNNRSGFFPAASIGWNIDQENFLKDSFITGLKLKASWGPEW